jgi:CheY-like chemotaxis protein/DNA-binding CsgD family transcriptional regulator
MMNAEKILVVDDDQTTARIVQLQLLKLGYPGVAIAKSGTEAIAKAQSCNPDLMLMDIKLGRGMDGIEAAKLIMNEFHVPVIYLTAYSDEDLLTRAMETRPLGYVNKPLRENDLRTTIALALERIKSTPSHQDETYGLEPDNWKVWLTCDMEGNLININTDAKRKLFSLGVSDVSQVLPVKHKELVSLCLQNHRHQLVTGRVDGKMYSWEYTPAKRASKVFLAMTDISHDSRTLDAEIQHTLLIEIMDRLATGLLLINENLKIFYQNRTAGKLFREHNNLKSKNGYLNCNDSEMTATLQRMILDGEDKTLTIGGTSTNPLHILITPLKNFRSNYGQNLPISILFLYSGSDNARLVEDILRSLYRMSRTEAKVTARLVKTPYMDEVATSLGITYNTARTHLKRIYKKTRTNRISSLIHLIITGPVGVVLHTRD